MVSRNKPTTALDIMAKQVFTVTKDTPLSEAAALMLRENIGCLPVVDEQGNLEGLITERMYQAALAGMPRPLSEQSVTERTILNMYGGYSAATTREAALEELRNETVADLMIRNPATVSEDDSLSQIASTMVQSHLSHIPVVRGRAVVGVIARHDLMRSVAGL